MTVSPSAGVKYKMRISGFFYNVAEYLDNGMKQVFTYLQ